MSNKTQLQENNSTLEFVIEQLQDKPTTEECMEAIDELSEQVAPLMLNGAKIASGEYTGNGNHGKTYPNNITFPFIPKIVVIWTTSTQHGSMPWVYGCTQLTTMTGVGSFKGVTATWVDNTVSWYSSDNASAQLNEEKVYRWVAIG